MKQKQKEVEIGDVWQNGVGNAKIIVVGFEEEIECGKMIEFAVCLRHSYMLDDFISVQKLPLKTIYKYYDYLGKKKNEFRTIFEVKEEE